MTTVILVIHMMIAATLIGVVLLPQPARPSATTTPAIARTEPQIEICISRPP